MEYNIKKTFPGWTVLSGLGNSPVVKSFSIWFVLIPIFAKITEGISGSIDLGVFNPPIVLKWDIPFSFKILYLATIFFSFANLIYQVCAPKIISQYRSYSDFKDKEGSFESLKQMFEPLLNGSDVGVRNVLLKDFFGHVATQQPVGFNSSDLRKKFDVSTVSSEHHAEAYANIKGAYNEEQPKTQLCISILYALGFACLVFLFVQNSIYVFKGWVF